ncbi:MAG: RNA polymerase sigma factor [Clostridia bacterium]|nr:RNA polymerase sigma factor [Clostridia bacterium]
MLRADNAIVEMYHARDEQAIAESARKYGKYCHSIAYAILHNDEDAEECVNDTYIKAWESMPPHRPTRLSTYLGKLTRNLSISRYRRDHAKKRFDGHEAVLDEMGECVPDTEGQSLSDQLALRDAINGFLASLPTRTRIVFLRRYWYFCSIYTIARTMGMSESDVKVTLMRTRNQFKAYLEKEGIII